jgi:hypothetical protein
LGAISPFLPEHLPQKAKEVGYPDVAANYVEMFGKNLGKTIGRFICCLDTA